MKAASEKSEGYTQRTAPLLSVEEAAAYLHMSVSWVNQTPRKFCPARKIGGRVKYLKDDLDRYIERSATFHRATHVNKSLIIQPKKDLSPKSARPRTIEINEHGRAFHGMKETGMSRRNSPPDANPREGVQNPEGTQ